jgi:predicted secreted Zn-dependent protease
MTGFCVNYRQKRNVGGFLDAWKIRPRLSNLVECRKKPDSSLERCKYHTGPDWSVNFLTRNKTLVLECLEPKFQQRYIRHGNEPPAIPAYQERNSSSFQGIRMQIPVHRDHAGRTVRTTRGE